MSQPGVGELAAVTLFQYPADRLGADRVRAAKCSPLLVFHCGCGEVGRFFDGCHAFLGRRTVLSRAGIHADWKKQCTLSGFFDRTRKIRALVCYMTEAWCQGCYDW